MADADNSAALDARRQAIRDAVEEAKTARLAKSVGFPRTAHAHACFDSAADRLNGAAGVHHPDPNIDGAVDQVCDKADGRVDRVWPAGSMPDHDESPVR